MIRPGRMVREVLAHVFKKSATVQYPFVKVEMPLRFRGKLNFDPASCIGCKICMKDCPSNAIEIRKVGDKRFECEIDLSKCIYCAQCVDSCPKKSLEATTEFELAALDRGTLKVIFHVSEPQPQPQPPAPTEPPGKPEVKTS